MKCLTIIILSSLILLTSVSAMVDNWVKCKNCSNPEIYYKVLEGGRNYRIKAEIELNTEINNVIKVLTNIENYCEWIDNCQITKILKQKNKSEGIYYTIFSAPWPYKKREAFISYSLIEIIPKQHYRLQQVCIPDYKPVNNRYERITRFKSSWEITITESGLTALSYTAETGGPKDMSDFVLNLFLCRSPHNTIKEFIKQCDFNSDN